MDWRWLQIASWYAQEKAQFEATTQATAFPEFLVWVFRAGCRVTREPREKKDERREWA